MTSRMTSLWYVYGIVPLVADAPAAHMPAPEGLDDVPVTVEAIAGAPIGALVSVLDGPDYEPTALEEHSGDVEWLSPRARAHDRVLTWASDRGAVIPLPMFSMFSGRDAVHAMLRERQGVLDATLARIGNAREYALRVYRVDAELLGAITSLSDRLRDLAASAAAASPGQRYLLERKLDAEKRAELRTVTQSLVDEMVAELQTCASDVERSPIPRVSDADAARGTMVLNAAFLVKPSHFAAFQQALSEIVARRQPQGFRFDFTGPWPPYHFATERAHVD